MIDYQTAYVPLSGMQIEFVKAKLQLFRIMDSSFYLQVLS